MIVRRDTLTYLERRLLDVHDQHIHRCTCCGTWLYRTQRCTTPGCPLPTVQQAAS